MEDQPIKVCTGCHLPKPLDEFRNDKYQPDGKRHRCRACMRREDKRRYDADPTTPRARTAASRLKHLTERHTYEEAYRLTHPQRNKERYQANKTFINAQNAARHAARQFERHNHTTAVIPGVNDLSTEQILEIRIAYEWTCQYCDTPLHDGQCSIDHITPMSRGGLNTLHNGVLACMLCNGKKHRGLPLRPVQMLLMTVAPAKLHKPKKKKGA